VFVDSFPSNRRGILYGCVMDGLFVSQCQPRSLDVVEKPMTSYVQSYFQQHNCKGAFEVKLPSACSFIVDGLAFFCRSSHYMFRPTWPSSGVYDISLFIPEGICFAVFVAFVACCYIMQFLI
jgi:hypothetical protein